MALLRTVPKNSRIRFEGLAYRPIHPDNVDRSLVKIVSAAGGRLLINMSTGRLTIIGENFEVDEIGTCPTWNKAVEMTKRMSALKSGMEATKETPERVRQD